MRTLRQLIARQCGVPVKTAIRNLLNEIKAARLSRHSFESLRELSGKQKLRIHLGCGDDIKEGWVNLDLRLDGPGPALQDDLETLFINYDIRLGLPIAENSCDIVYSCHFFEHLNYKEGVQLMRDCHRVLRPGGVFRFCLPNFKRAFEAYVKNDHKYFDSLLEMQWPGQLRDIRNVLPEVEHGTESIVDYINYVVYQSGEHKCVYDEEKVMLLLRHIGFRQVAPSSFEASIDVDSEVRRNYSFYLEAIK
jgi:predicted SAM-dependent methyltransferase